MTTPNLSLSELAASQAQPHLTVNAALRKLDGVVQLSFSDFATVPTGSEVEGHRYIVAAPATGLFDNREDQVAIKVGGSWQFVQPSPGWLAYNVTEAQHYLYSQSGSPSAWIVFQVGAQMLGQLSDVAVAGSPSPQDGDVLTFDSATQTWVAAAPSVSGGAGTHASVSRTSTQTISSATWTAVTWPTEDVDTGNYFSSGSSDRFSIADTGFYSITANIRFGSPSSLNCSACICKNGIPGTGTNLAGQYLVPGVGNSQLSCSWSGQLTAGDYVVVGVYSSVGSNGPDASGPNNFSIVRIA